MHPNIDLTVVNTQGHGVIQFAKNYSRWECLVLLLNDGRAPASSQLMRKIDFRLWRSACLGQPDVVSHLLKCERINVNFCPTTLSPYLSSSYAFTTPLAAACLGGETEIVRLLLADDRVDVNLM